MTKFWSDATPADPPRIAKEVRLTFLDGHRGVAILLVVLFHAYARYPDLVPSGHHFAANPFLANGWIGVQLFFLISGFVILMTLERCDSFADFITRRWLRLFPAMLLCSLLDLSLSPLLPERPHGTPITRDLLPGLTFIEPSWWGILLGSHQGVLEGAFWSLFVEVKFYFVFGIFFFAVGESIAVAGIFILFVLTMLLGLAGKISQLAAIDFHSIQLAAEGMSFDEFGWFAAGALFYLFHKKNRQTYLWLGLAAALASAGALGGFQLKPKLPALCVVILFTISMLSPRVRSLLENPLLLFLGFVSYPLYLVHENMMVALTVKLSRSAPDLPHFLMPILPIFAVVGLAWLVAEFAEPSLKSWIRPVYDRARALMSLQ